MGPKKPKEGKVEKPATLTEVEKTFYEITIADLNRKVARMKGTIETLETRNEELEEQLKRLDTDRADIIAYIKKTLTSKTNEAEELKEKVAGLEEIREIETKQFKDKVTELNKEFNTMREQLSSEVKLLSGKLNSMEEFRAMREDLMKKFEKQDNDFHEQEIKYKRVIYDLEKEFVIGKDKQKKEMEARLLILAQDFQDATEIRIAASTHRVIRENIAINNELDAIISNQAKLSEEHEMYKQKERAARLALEVVENEKEKAIQKNLVQTKIIEQLSVEHDNMEKDIAGLRKTEIDLRKLHEHFEVLSEQNQNMALEIYNLKEQLEIFTSDKDKVLVDARIAIKESARLKQILQNTRLSLKAGLKLQEWKAADPTRELEDRKELLNNLLEIINGSQSESTIAVVSPTASVYKQGDLGFVPSPSKASLKRGQSIVEQPDIAVETATVKSESSASSLVTLPEMGLASYKSLERSATAEEEVSDDDKSGSNESKSEEADAEVKAIIEVENETEVKEKGEE